VQTIELYALYRRCYEAYDRDRGLSLGPACRSAVEFAVAEFAEEDAANGTPLRSAQQFERCVGQGLDALLRLGLAPAA
jgi:hypothetical protein